MRKRRFFHDAEVRVEITRSSKPIPSLCKIDSGTVAHTRWAQVSAIESCFTTRLHKERVWVRRHTIPEQLGWKARNKRTEIGRSPRTVPRSGKRSNGYCIKHPEEVLRVQLADGGGVKNSVRKPAVGKYCSRYLPAFQEHIRSASARHCLQGKFPHVTRIEGMTYIVLSIAVA